MPVRLNQPLSKTPNADEQAMLAQLQGNILKGHGRKHTAHVFLRFDAAEQAGARAFLKSLASKLTTASLQLANSAKFRAAKKAGKAAISTPPFMTCVLSASGYTALGIAAPNQPADNAFRGGMKSRAPLLNDPAAATWDIGYQNENHAMILIGGDANATTAAKSKQIDDALKALASTIPTSVTVIGVERGRAYFNGNEDGIEHFGYVDGRSQPLLRESDIEREDAGGDGIVRWSPSFPLKQVLLRDPASNDANAFGSYFVYRKLEQNVQAFKAAETTLGAELQQLAVAQGHLFDPELAGAMIVGRFEDGTPVLLQNAEGMHHPVPNDFDYSGDQSGLKCPFHAHIRKTNPRGDTARMFGVSLESEREHIMARRGITYGARKQNKKKAFLDQPTKDVGLLFMAYQSNVINQFEFTQASWANNTSFVNASTGIDPVIGQGSASNKQKHRAGWGDVQASTQDSRFADFVTLKGGEYFFAPSLAFFAGL